MPYDLKQVTLSLLKEGVQDIERQLENGRVVEQGSILRYTGSSTEFPFKESEPVMFIAVPYLHLKQGKRSPAGAEGFVSMTLLQSLYGYDLGDEQEYTYAIEKMKPFLSKKIHVPQLWCLLIGSSKLVLAGTAFHESACRAVLTCLGILVTMGDCSLAEVQDGCISIDQRIPGTLGGSLLVKVLDADHEVFRIVVDRDCSFWVCVYPSKTNLTSTLTLT